MRIIGGKDYYDGAAAYGIDPGIVFVRKEFRLTNGEMDSIGRYVTGNFFLRPISEELTWNNRQKYVSGQMSHDVKIVVHNPILVFCGKIYSGIFVTINEGRFPNETKTEHRFWNSEKFDAFLEQQGWQVESQYGYLEKGQNRLDSIFAVKELTGEPLQALMAKQIVTITPKEKPLLQRDYIYRGTSGWKDQDSDYVANADTLKDWDFQKAVDPVTAFQEISQWVGGTLASHGPNIIEIQDDVVKAHKAGFDKWSFRNKTAKSKP